jgi:hypothetical protein
LPAGLRRTISAIKPGEIIGESQASVLTLTIYVSSTFTNIEGAVKSLAGSPWIAPALTSKRDQDIERANSALDRYNTEKDADSGIQE